MSFRNLLLILGISVSLVSGKVSADCPAETQIHSSGNYQICAAGQDISVSFDIVKPTAELGLMLKNAWGVEGFVPDRIISAIAIKGDAKQSNAWLSSYIDLTNVRIASIACTGSECAFSIDGGDASTSYKATLIIKEGKVVSRKVVHSEFPENVFEVSHYHFHFDEEM